MTTRIAFAARLAAIGSACWLSLGAALASGSTGAEVMVVYNSRLAESKAVAEHYARARGVPSRQVLGLALSRNETITRKEFNDSLQKPLLKRIESLKLWHYGEREAPDENRRLVRSPGWVVDAKLRYVVLCYGVPLRIAHDKDLFEAIENSTRPELRRNNAAVDSELARLPLVQQSLPLLGPQRNPVYAVTNAMWVSPTNGVLMVARLDGPSVAIARGLVDKALEAETNGLWGRAYIDVRGNVEPGMRQGDEWLRGAAEICRVLGLETLVDEFGDVFPAGFPMSHIAFYAGWYREHVAGPFAQPTVEFMPGAFAYHLHSFSAATLRDTNRHWAAPLLAGGATCTMGNVDEPYLGGTPDLAVFTARLIYQGFTLGEAAYAAQPVLSWQTTVIGDPLYRPFGQNPAVLHDQLERRGSPLIEWSHLRLLNVNQARGVPVGELIQLLEQNPLTKQSAVLTEKLGTLYGAQGKPSSAIMTWQQALGLNPSPQQRLRLRLTLADKLQDQGRDAEALSNFQALLNESPCYADRLVILRKALALAQKLKRPEDAHELETQIRMLTTPTP